MDACLATHPKDPAARHKAKVLHEAPQTIIYVAPTDYRVSNPPASPNTPTKVGPNVISTPSIFTDLKERKKDPARAGPCSGPYLKTPTCNARVHA